MTHTEEDRQLQELKALLVSTPKWIQLVALRLLKLSMEDADFWIHFQAVTAECGFMPPAELDTFMDRWIKEHPDRGSADI